MSYDENDDIWERRAERNYDEFTARPKRYALKVFAWVLGVVIALSILFAVIGWIGSWGGEAKRLTSPDHSREQVTAVLDDWTTLQATAGNVCDAKASAREQGDPQLVEDPAFAYRAAYRRIKADYDRRMNNLFEAYVTRHLPLPGSIQNLPRTAPTLREAVAEAC